MSDNVKQESIEIAETKEQVNEVDKSKAEAMNEKAAKKALKEKKKKEKQPADLCSDRRTHFPLCSVKALWRKRGSSRGNYDTGTDRGSSADG